MYSGKIQPFHTVREGFLRIKEENPEDSPFSRIFSVFIKYLKVWNIQFTVSSRWLPTVAASCEQYIKFFAPQDGTGRVRRVPVALHRNNVIGCKYRLFNVYPNVGQDFRPITAAERGRHHRRHLPFCLWL